MRLTTQTTDTFMRRLASAPDSELAEIAKHCTTTAKDEEQSFDMRVTAQKTATVARALVKSRRG